LADGIALDRVLQWRNVIADVETNQTLDGLQRNLFWDGVFQAATATVTAVGLMVLSYARGPDRRLPSPMRTLVRLALVGWGTFHIVDQVLFHLLLDLHDIPEGVDSPELGNSSFFAAGLALAAAGWLLVRRGGSGALPVAGA
jgi:uncharacterized membrane protein